MRKTNVKLKNKNGEDVIYSGIATVSLDGEDGNKKTFSLGSLKEQTIALDFSNGNQEVSAADDELFEKVIIEQPETFKAENIAQGVIIAGIEGTFEGAREMPTLNKPTISRNSDIITISNPSTNGNFNKGFNIYSNDEVGFYITATTFSIIGKFEAEHDYRIEATCVNPLMNESQKSNSINFAVYSVVKDFDEFISTTDTTTKISDGLKYTLYIKSAFGYWLPELIKVYKKANETDEYILTDEYTYSMYSGEITFNAMDSNIKIEVEADEEPQLKRPDVELIAKEFSLKTDYPLYAQKLLFYDNEELFLESEKTIEPISAEVSSLGSTYAFYLDSDGYYWPENKSVQNSFAIVRLTIRNTDIDNTIKIFWMQSSEQGYDFGLVGPIDTALSLGAGVDSGVILNAQNRNATTPQELALNAPSGTHFYDIKYRKDGSVNSGWDAFIFKVDASNVVGNIVSDDMTLTEDYLLKLSNEYYRLKKSANVTHHVYVDDELIYEEKEGI